MTAQEVVLERRKRWVKYMEDHKDLRGYGYMVAFRKDNKEEICSACAIGMGILSMAQDLAIPAVEAKECYVMRGNLEPRFEFNEYFGMERMHMKGIMASNDMGKSFGFLRESIMRSKVKIYDGTVEFEHG